MINLPIQDERIFQRLMKLANQEARSIDDLLDALITIYEEHQPQDNPLLQMAAAADALGLTADRDDISENFDTLLRETWMNNPE